MSRNLRYKSVASEKSPLKTVPRRASLDSSSSDGYTALDEQSDDEEEDEPDVERAEEEEIIKGSSAQNPRPSNETDLSSWNGFETEDDVLDAKGQFFEEQYARTQGLDQSMSVDDVSPSRKSVRFAMNDDSDDSNTIESDGEQFEGLYGDIFLDQNSLDPQFRSFIEQSPVSDGDEFWEVAEMNQPLRSDDRDIAHAQDSPLGFDNLEESDNTSEAGSSGYDTDLGETTDEDLPPEANIVRTKSVLRRPSDVSSSEEEIPRGPSRGPSRVPTGPKLGQFLQDGSKPFAVLDNTGKRIIMFKAKIGRRNSTGNPPETVHLAQLGPPIEFSPGQDFSPMVNGPANVMMSAFHDGNVLGPSEAFFPFVEILPDGAMIQDSLSDDFDYSGEDDNLRLNDFIEFNEASSDDGGEELNQSSDSPAILGDPSSTPARPTTARSEDQILPGFSSHHFDPMKVGAFRQNQDRHQQLARNKVSQDSLGFQGTSIVRGIRNDRLAEAGNTPFTPLRKQRKRQPAIDPSSPLAHVTNSTHLTGGSMMERKRKVERHEDARGHKRTKSLI